MAQRLTTCTFCGVGCGLYLETQHNLVAGVYPSLSHPTSQGKLCVRGWHVHEVASSPDRLKRPLIKRHGRFHSVTWEEALQYTASRLLHIRNRFGPDSIAFLNSPRCSNEESYLLQKLARAVIGTNNVDHGAGVYCNNSLNVLMETLGTAAATGSIADLACSQVILVDGVDLNRQLPTIAGTVIRAKLKGAKLIVIDTRRHRVAESADLFLQIRPGTETLLYGAMAKVIVDRALVDLPFIKARCHGYPQFLEQVLNYDLLQAADACGVPAELIEEAALTYARASAAALLYSTGVEARDAQSIQAVVNLVLLTGNLGKPGAGLFPLHEHNNLQGACDMGVLPDRLPGYCPVHDAAARERLGALWKSALPSKPGLNSETVLGDRGRGTVKALWLGRYDPLGTARLSEASQSLGQFEFVVAQHLFMTDTARQVDILLPTTAFGEEQVTFTSTERRIQVAEKVIDPAPGPMPAWEQLARLASAMGAEWGYRCASDVMDEIAQAVPFYSGVSYDNLSRDFGRQWPCTTDRPLGTARLFEDHMNGPGFGFTPLPPPREVEVTPDYPLTLVFGHSLYYWHNSVLIRHSETLQREYRVLLLDYPEGFVEINTEDAQELQIRDHKKIRISARDGAAFARARVTPEVRKGTVSAPYFVAELERQLTGGVSDGSPFIQVRIEKETA